MPSKDTVKLVDENTFASGTPNRKYVWTVQTPQIFDSSLIRAAYDTQYQESFTDDASVVEQMTSHRISLCAGERTNIKITTPDDMIYAHAIAEALKEQSN